MAKRKFIEDSDEDDHEAEPISFPAPSFHTQLSQGNQVNLQNSIGNSAGPSSCSINTSTSSTEVLNSEVACAYNHLMQPTPESIESTVKERNTLQHSTTPNASRSKRKRALSNLESPSPKVPDRRRTNGSTKERDLFVFHGSSDGELETSSKAKNMRGRVERPKNVDGSSDHGGRKVPLIFADFAVRDQSILSGPAITPILDLASVQPPPSDGRSDWRKLQNLVRMSDSANSEERLSTAVAMPKYQSDGVENANIEHASEDLHSSAIAAQKTLSASDVQEEPSSSSSLISPSKMIVAEDPKPGKVQLQSDDMEDELSGSGDVDANGKRNPMVLLPQPLKWQQDPPTECEAYNDNDDETQATRNRKRKTARESTADELGSDDFSIGIPQVHYQKRPTRSRSGRDPQELFVPTDYSKKPENVAKVVVSRKRRLKRSKTTAFQELRPVNSEEEDEEPPQINGNANHKNNIHEDTDDQQSPTLNTEPESAGHDKAVKDDLEAQQAKETPRPIKRRGRPKKGKMMEESKHHTKAPDEQTERESTREGNRTEPESIDTRNPPIGPESNIVLDHEIHIDNQDDSTEATPNIDIPAATENKILTHTSGNPQPAHQHDVAVASNSDLIPSKTTTIPAPATPKKPDTAPAKGGPEQHSPISNNGKVAYRVGLSKRARIEPLLRVVRK